MIWLFLLIILFPLNLLAGFSVSGITDPASVAGIAEPASVSGIASDYTPPVSCDTCTGALLFTSHFENDDDIENGDPCGCSTNVDKTWTLSGATYSTTQKSDGSYAVYIGDDLHTAVIPIDVDRAVGTMVFDIYVTTYAQYTLYVAASVSSSNYLGCYAQSTGYITCEYKGDNAPIWVEAAMTNNAWHTVTFKWRTGATNPAISVQVDANAAVTKDNDLTAIIGTWTPFQINLPYLTNAAQFYLDNMKIYNTWQ